MRGRGLIVGGSGLIVVGLIVVGPAIWLLLDQLSQQLFGAPLVGIAIGEGGVTVPLIMTALGTAAVIGGAWVRATGVRQRREPGRPEEPAKPEESATNGD